MPAQLPDHTDGCEATEQYLEQHAAGARVKVRIYWGFEEKPRHQHEKRQHQAFLHYRSPIRRRPKVRLAESPGFVTLGVTPRCHIFGVLARP